MYFAEGYNGLKNSFGITCIVLYTNYSDSLIKKKENGEEDARKTTYQLKESTKTFLEELKELAKK